MQLRARFSTQSLDFFGAIRASQYDNQIRDWIKNEVGFEIVAEKENLTEMTKRLVGPMCLHAGDSFSSSVYIGYKIAVGALSNQSKKGEGENCIYAFVSVRWASFALNALPLLLLMLLLLQISKIDLPVFKPMHMNLEMLFAEGERLVAEQELVKNTNLASEYLKNTGDGGPGLACNLQPPGGK